MNRTPLISVVIPTRNRAQYLARAIESVRAQTYPAWELIIVDDGSTDDTPQVVQAFHDARIRYFRQAAGERARARNLGWHHARGEFVAFLDDDDLWLARKLEETLTGFTRAEVGVVYTAWQFIDANDRILPQPPAFTPKRGKVLPDLLRSNLFVSVHPALLRRECLVAVDGFDVTTVPAEDWDLWIRIAQQGYEFECIGEPLALYRVHGANTLKDWARLEQGTQTVLEKAFAHCAQPDLRALRAECFARNDFRNAVRRFTDGDVEGGSHLFAQAVRAFPRLLDERGTFYEVIGATQPEGYKGTWHFLDLDKGERYITAALEAAFRASSEPRSPDLKQRHARAWGEAYFVSGLLAYAIGDGQRARTMLRRAYAVYPPLAARPTFWLTFAKSFLPARLVQMYRRYVSNGWRRSRQ